MSSIFGNKLKISVFGQSHGRAIGVVIDGLPSGEIIDTDELMRFMARRRPGGDYATKRVEKDAPIILSGVEGGKTCGSPLCAIIENTGAHPADYAELADKPRPSHADYAAYVKWGGTADMRGGGHFSGRLTAPLCIAGGVALQILKRRGVAVGAHLYEAGGVRDDAFPLLPDSRLFDGIANSSFPMISEDAAKRACRAIEAAAADGDSLGGIVECAVAGVEAGLGSPMFDGVENRLASAVFGIQAVKGVEFGAGFAAASMRGSRSNDPFMIGENGCVQTEKNDSGGILGGITNGMPIVLRAAFKPTPSIAKQQRTVRLRDMTEDTLAVRGRHDPCVAVRAVPVVEAVVAAVILDLILEGK